MIGELVIRIIMIIQFTLNIYFSFSLENELYDEIYRSFNFHRTFHFNIIQKQVQFNKGNI